MDIVEFLCLLYDHKLMENYMRDLLKKKNSRFGPMNKSKQWCQQWVCVPGYEVT